MLLGLVKKNQAMATINNSILINETNHGFQKVGLLFDVGSVQGFGIALGLGLVAFACIFVKFVIIYYIKYHAPKDRPINKLIRYDQVISMSFTYCIYNKHLLFQACQYAGFTTISVSSIASIGLQTPLNKYIGIQDCQIYTTVAISTCHWVAVGGFLIALYRLLCLKGRQVEVQSMLKIGLIYLIFFGINLIQIMSQVGWEMTLFYNFCFGKNQSSGNVENQFLSITLLDKIIGARAIIMGQILVSSEFGIYMYIMYCLWKHDENYFQSKIITNRMLNTRKEKNIITIKGQMFTFFVEIGITMYLIFQNLFSELSHDTSLIAVTFVTSFTIISLSNLFTSHEMRRYVKSKVE